MIPDRLREIIGSAMNHRLIQPAIEPGTMLHDIEMDGLEREEIAMGIEDELSCELGSTMHGNWQSISDIMADYTRLGGT